MSWDSFLSVHAWQFVALAFLLGGSAFFSGTETALFSLSQGRLLRMSQGGPGGRAVAALMRDPQRVLNTLLLGNMLVNATYTCICAVTIIDLEQAGASAWAVAAASLAPLVLLILLGESTPKILALAVLDRWAVAAAVPLTLIQRALTPALWLLERLAVRPLCRLLAGRPAAPSDVTPDELGAVLELSARRGLIDRDSGALLREIVSLTGRRVTDIMVPRVDMVAYDADGDAEGLRDLFRHSGKRRIPIYQGDIDHIVGVVHARRLLLNPSGPIRDLAERVLFVPEAANLERLLLQFRVKRRKLAIVADEYGGTAGLVTLKDVLEEIVGDIQDRWEAPASPPIQRTGPRQYLLRGDLPIHEWAETFQMPLSSRRISTIGGFVTSLLGRVPRVGDQVTYRNLLFTVQGVRGRRIDRLALTLAEGRS